MTSLFLNIDPRDFDFHNLTYAFLSLDMVVWCFFFRGCGTGYSEGCHTRKSYLGYKEEFCVCKGDNCNSSTHTLANILTMLVVAVVRYMMWIWITDRVDSRLQLNKWEIFNLIVDYKGVYKCWNHWYKL